MYATNPALWRGLNHLVLPEDGHVLPNRAEQAHHCRHRAAGLLLELATTNFSLSCLLRKDHFQAKGTCSTSDKLSSRFLGGGSCVGGLEKANTGVCRESTLKLLQCRGPMSTCLIQFCNCSPPRLQLLAVALRAGS